MQKGGLTVVSVDVAEEEVEVFDIEVEQDHSFLVHGAVLHNCAACGSLDGQTWKTGEKHPQPALHFGCRCILTPWLKSWEELAREQGGDTALARELDRMDPGTRASMDGQVSGTMTYSDWLARQDRTSLDTILGPGRAKLYASGKVGLSDLVDHAGNEISLKDLRKAL